MNNKMDYLDKEMPTQNWIGNLILSGQIIPWKVAPQQSLSPFYLTK